MKTGNLVCWYKFTMAREIPWFADHRGITCYEDAWSSLQPKLHCSGLAAVYGWCRSVHCEARHWSSQLWTG